uniref:(northern house mosquito) hypothetical protein n=1 Tax=Culex pipiens TaxID=7175 RepID=A0A8D8AZK3_CULPI
MACVHFEGGSIIEKSVRFESLGVCLYINRIHDRYIKKKKKRNKLFTETNFFTRETSKVKRNLVQFLVASCGESAVKPETICTGCGLRVLLGCRSVRSINVILWSAPERKRSIYLHVGGARVMCW